MKIKQESFSIVFISYCLCNFLLYFRDYPGGDGVGQTALEAVAGYSVSASAHGALLVFCFDWDLRLASSILMTGSPLHTTGNLDWGV